MWTDSGSNPIAISHRPARLLILGFKILRSNLPVALVVCGFQSDMWKDSGSKTSKHLGLGSGRISWAICGKIQGQRAGCEKWCILVICGQIQGQWGRCDKWCILVICGQIQGELLFCREWLPCL